MTIQISKEDYFKLMFKNIRELNYQTGMKYQTIEDIKENDPIVHEMHFEGLGLTKIKIIDEPNK